MNNPSDNDYKEVATITAIVGCIIAAIALIPAFGEWLQERQAAQQAAVPTPTATSVCEVPSLVGRSQPDAEQRLAVLGLRVIVSAGEPSEVPAGTVMAQRPDAETRLEPCAGEIRLIVSPGLPPTNTPLPTDTPIPTDTPVPPAAPPTEIPLPTATPIPPTATPAPGQSEVINAINASRVQEVARLEGHTGDVTFVAFTSDGQTLASFGQGDGLRFWNVADGSLDSALESDFNGAQSVAISPDWQVTP